MNITSSRRARRLWYILPHRHSPTRFGPVDGERCAKCWRRVKPAYAARHRLGCLVVNTRNWE